MRPGSKRVFAIFFEWETCACSGCDISVVVHVFKIDCCKILQHLECVYYSASATLAREWNTLCEFSLFQGIFPAVGYDHTVQTTQSLQPWWRCAESRYATENNSLLNYEENIRTVLRRESDFLQQFLHTPCLTKLKRPQQIARKNSKCWNEHSRRSASVSGCKFSTTNENASGTSSIYGSTATSSLKTAMQRGSGGTDAALSTMNLSLTEMSAEILVNGALLWACAETRRSVQIGAKKSSFDPYSTAALSVDVTYSGLGALLSHQKKMMVFEHVMRARFAHSPV